MNSSALISPQYDNDFFKSIARHPQVWPMITDDGCTEEFDFPESNLYLVAESNGERIGFFMLSAINSICVEVHTIFHPKAFGSVISYAVELINWVFNNTQFKKIITFVPSDNPKAKRLAEKAGMEAEGLIKGSYLRAGKLLDQHILGVSKCQQFQH